MKTTLCSTIQNQKKQLANVAMLSFGGGQLDEDTGLVHFLFRDYDPATGFFIQRDPLGLRGGDVDVYGYCLDDPVNMVDPLGLVSLPFLVSKSSVRGSIRENIPRYGFTVDCTDEELNELIDIVRDSEVEAFRKSYDKLPDAGKKLSPPERKEMIKESNEQRGIINDILNRWDNSCIESQNIGGHN